MRGLILFGLGVLGFCAGVYAMLRTLRTGSAHLRGGRKITRERNPALYWTNVAALCVLMVLSLVVIGIAAHT